jgi:integrase
MSTIKLTERSVERLTAPDPSGKQVLHWDSDLRGFGVLVSGVTNTKTYVVQRAISGKTRRITIGPTNVGTLTEARSRAEKVLGDFYKGIDPKSGRKGAMTLRDALDAYLDARKSLKAKTARDYRTGVERYLAPWLDLALKDITGEMIELRHRSLQVEIAERGRYGGKGAANNAIRALGTLWKFAEEREPDLPKNPVKRMERQWFPIHSRERLVKSDNLPAFYRAVMELPSAVHRDYLLLLLFTGMRRSEAATLTWDDVDFAQRLIRVPSQRTKMGRKLDLPMSSFVHDLLVARRAVGVASPFIFFSATSKSGHVNEGKSLAMVAEATGIKISAHDLRRTFLTVAESADISVMALKALVNHTLGGDVTSGYVVMTTERLRAPCQQICDRLKELCQVEAVEGQNVARMR